MRLRSIKSKLLIAVSALVIGSGLLISLPPDEASVFVARLEALGHESWIIGDVLDGDPHVTVV